MSKVTEPILLDKTGQEMLKEIKTLNTLMGLQVGVNMGEVADLNEIRNIVRSGKAEKVFNIGDQIIVPWTDIETGVTYDAVLNIVHFGDVTLADGETVPGMFLQWNYATPFGVQFDQYEAFYVAGDAELPAGTYNITVGANWGTNCKENEKYQFALTKPVPQGGMLAGFYRMPDAAPAEWKVYSFADGSATTPIETVSVTQGSAGSSLGTFKPAGEGNLNSLHRLAYGYNRWAQSALRQWLNSKEKKGKWWTSQNKYDRIPDQCAMKAGFMSGFDEEFLSCVQPIKIVTALNTVTDSGDGETETTYDRFFVPSLQQMYCVPQKADVEGDIWEYWKRASGLTEPMKQSGTYPQIRTFGIENKTAAQTVRLRSANRGNASNTWVVNSSGSVNTYSATSAHRCAPACVIC